MTNPSALSPRAKIILACAMALSVAAFFANAYLGNKAEPLNGEWFVGADTYMRLVRVTDWWNAGEWYQSVSARSNWPHGESLHWTRPLDILLMVLAAPLALFVGLPKALFIAGVLVSPLAGIAAMALLVWGTRPLLDTRGQAILVLLFAFQPITRFYFLAARPDHHSLILLAFTATLALVIRHALSPDEHKHAPSWAGLATALGLWVSVESLTTELFALAAFGLVWLASGDQRALLALKRFATVGALTLAVCLGLERPPSEWLNSVEFDRLSTVHMVLLALIALGVEVMWRARVKLGGSVVLRLTGGALGAGLAAIAMAGLYPNFFKGPFGAAMDPRLAEMWLDKIQELQPLYKTDPETLMGAAQIAGPTVWLAVWGVLTLRNPRRTRADVRLAWGVLAGGALYLPLTIVQVRWGAYLGVLVAVPWAIVLQRVLDWQGGPKSGDTPLLRVPAFVAVVLLHLAVMAFIAALRTDTPEGRGDACAWRDLAPYLNSPAFADGQPQVLLTHTHQGPEVMYRTPHRVIGSPYHRNTEGILDNHQAFAATNMAESRAILARRNVDYVVLCVDSPEERLFLKIEGETLLRRLVTGNGPAWLQKTPLPDGLEALFRVFRFVPNQSQPER